MFDRPFTRLVALLNRECALLKDGDIVGAAALTDAKERLLVALAAKELRAGEADRLRHLAERNQALVQAAGRGIEAARDRLEAIRRGADIHAYAANGTREMIRKPVMTLQKRA